MGRSPFRLVLRLPRTDTDPAAGRGGARDVLFIRPLALEKGALEVAKTPQEFCRWQSCPTRAELLQQNTNKKVGDSGRPARAPHGSARYFVLRDCTKHN